MIARVDNPDRVLRRAVVLAAGRGRRMGEWSQRRPKPLAPVAGRPLLFRLLDELRAAGFRRVEIVTGHLGDLLEAEVRREIDASPHAVEVGFCRQGALTGTASALLACAEACEDEAFLLTWGDVLATAADYRAVTTAFCSELWDHVLGVNELDDPTQGAAVEVAPDGSVLGLVEKPAPGSSSTRWNNSGVFGFAPEVFEYARRVPRSSRGEHELTAAIGQMLTDGRRIGACPLRGWQHIGTPEELARARPARSRT